MTSIVLFLIVGLVAGALAKYVLPSPATNWVQTLILGLFGAFVGGYLGVFTWTGSGIIGQIICATIGAVILLAIWNLVVSGRNKGNTP